MRYKVLVKKIADVLKKWKATLDDMEIRLKAERQKIVDYADSMRGVWTDSYIEQYIAQNSPDEKIRQVYTEEKAKVTPFVNEYLEKLQNQIDDFFNAPVSQEFANRIMLTKMTGLQLSDLEFRLLRSSVSTYAEARLLNELAETRTKKTEAVAIDGSGQPEKVEKKVPAPYLYLDIPDIEEVYNGFSEFKRSALGLLNSYAGPTAKISFALEKQVPDYISVAMDAFIRIKSDEKFLKIMDKANSILPENKAKKELTEADRALIDRLISPAYTPAKTTVLEVAATSEYVEELLRLDPRYSKFFDEK